MGVVTVWVSCVSCITRVTSTVVTVIEVRGSENWGSHRSRGVARVCSLPGSNLFSVIQVDKGTLSRSKGGMISSLSLSKSGSKGLFGSLDLGGV